MALPRPQYTAAEYLTFERASETKHEFIDGEIVAMAGGGRNHNEIIGNLFFHLRRMLAGGPCRPFLSETRVKAAGGRLYTYPDVSVVCGEAQFEDAALDTLLNPTVIIEVLSPSTESYDRGAKFRRYQTLPSLREYVLVGQDSAQVEHYVRQDDGSWRYVIVEGLEARLMLPTPGVALALSDVYERVEFQHD